MPLDVQGTSYLKLPVGTTAQRPQLSSVRQPTDANGTIRYNTSLSSIEELKILAIASIANYGQSRMV